MQPVEITRQWSAAISPAAEKTYQANELFWQRAKVVGQCALAALAIGVALCPFFLPITYTALFSTLIFSPWALIPQLLLPPFITLLANWINFKIHESAMLKEKSGSLRTHQEYLATNSPQDFMKEALEKTFGKSLSEELRASILTKLETPILIPILSHLKEACQKEEKLLGELTKKIEEARANKKEPSAKTNWEPVYQLEGALAATRAHRIFLWTFLTVEGGEERFAESFKKYGLHIEKALGELVKAHETSFEEFACAATYKDPRAEKFLRVNDLPFEKDETILFNSPIGKLLSRCSQDISRSDLSNVNAAEDIHDLLGALLNPAKAKEAAIECA